MLGEALKIIRVFNNMTQQELAKELGISHSYLSQIESSKRQATLETLKAFSKFFGIPVSSLLFFSEQLAPGEPGNERSSRLEFGHKILSLLRNIERVTQ